MEKVETRALSTDAPSLRNREAMELKRARFLPMFELVLPSVVIVILLWIGDAECPEPVYRYLRSQQSTVQVAVQVVAHALALLQASSLCATFNLSTRLRFLKHPTSLRDLSLWIAISTARVDLNLPRPLLTLNAIFVLATLLPGALWAGALSPLFVLKTRKLGDVVLPAFTNGTESRAIWDSQFRTRFGHQVWNINDNCTVVNDARGLVPSCPVPTLQGPLLLSASSASTLDGEPRKHSKLDNPTWEYIGRSFGAGSSTGHANESLADDKILSYSYTEFGYVTNVSCIQNSTSDFRFRLIESMNHDMTPAEYQYTHHPELEFDHAEPMILARLSTYLAEGYLPNSIMGAPEYFPVISWRKDYKSLATWAAIVTAGRNMVAVAVGNDRYQELDKIQCEVFFVPTAFNVTMNRSQHSIIVEPQSSITAHDVDPTGHLQANVIHSLNLLSRMTPSLYVSVLGETLSRNVERMQKQQPYRNRSEVVTSAVAESFTAILDDILVAYGASQIVNAHDATASATHGVVEAAQIGQPLYRNLVLALNTLIAMVVAFEAARTKCWRSLTRLNYLDSKSMIIAASAGGGGIAEVVASRHDAGETGWVADPSDPIARGVRVEWRPCSRSLDGTEMGAIVKARDYGVVVGMRERRGRELGEAVKLV